MVILGSSCGVDDQKWDHDFPHLPSILLDSYFWRCGPGKTHRCLLALLRNDPGRFQRPYEMLGITVAFSHGLVRSLFAVLLL